MKWHGMTDANEAVADSNKFADPVRGEYVRKPPQPDRQVQFCPQKRGQYSTLNDKNGILKQ
ncbi:MAG: hypothetical protein AB7F61_19660, partial [Desulfobulbus sp.]